MFNLLPLGQIQPLEPLHLAHRAPYGAGNSVVGEWRPLIQSPSPYQVPKPQVATQPWPLNYIWIGVKPCLLLPHKSGLGPSHGPFSPAGTSHTLFPPQGPMGARPCLFPLQGQVMPLFFSLKGKVMPHFPCGTGLHWGCPALPSMQPDGAQCTSPRVGSGSPAGSGSGIDVTLPKQPAVLRKKSSTPALECK